MDPITIKEIEVLQLSEIKWLPPSEIKKTRLREKVSQAVMAKILNVTPFCPFCLNGELAFCKLFNAF